MTAVDVVRQSARSGEFQDLYARARSAVHAWPLNGHSDDVAVVGRRRLPAQLNLTLIAEPTALSEIRAALRVWLETAAVDDSTKSDLLLAVCEAASNSIEHSHSTVDGPAQHQSVDIRIEATCTANLIEFTVADNGRWRIRDKRGKRDHRGHGISLMQALTNFFAIEVSDEGTTVRLQKWLP